MKPPSFEYHQPKQLSEALDLLAKFGETAKPLAGGQSLVPLMNMRLARPAQIVDLNRLKELDYLTIENGELRIGAMTRQRVLERSPVVAENWPILCEATRYIGHVQIRSRGTVGGSLAHAYPAAELPLVMSALDATLVLRDRNGERVVPVKDFFVDVMTTVLEPGELLTEIRIPSLPDRTGTAFEEVSRRYGDFALMAVAGAVSLAADGTAKRIRLAFAGAVPNLSLRAEARLVGRKPDQELFSAAAREAAAELSCEADIHASAEYRRQIAEVLARRVLEQSMQRARNRSATS